VPQDPIFNSFWIGGLECSTHRLRSGKRLDLLAATRHNEFCQTDYMRLKAQGFSTIRSGIRWHLIESKPEQYDFSSVIPMLRAAQTQDIQVIWDICHYGWPDDIDLMKPEFVRRFARFAGAFAHVIREETDSSPLFCPINEISFFSWAAGDVAYLNPFYHERSFELKVQLVRAAIEGIEAIWKELPGARIVHVDPVINIIPDPQRPNDLPEAEGYRLAQYQAWDMLAGRIWPQVGGHPKYLDIIGVNYYPNNQWIHEGSMLDYHHSLYRPFRQILLEVWERYQRPMFIGETGAEGDFRGEWLRYIGEEVAAAIRAGVPLHGLCLYPILNHPGWDDDRHCCNGLWDYADENGERSIFQPLADEIRRVDVLVRAAQVAHKAKRETSIVRMQSIAFGIDQPRVCLFTDSLEASGMGEHMLTLANELRNDHVITLVMPSNEANSGLLSRAEKSGIRVLPLQVRGEDRQQWESLRDFLRSERIDIFHAHAGIGWEGHAGIHAAWFANVPLRIRTEHLPWLITKSDEKHQYLKLLHKLHHVICVSEESRQSYLKAGIAPERMNVIRNGITFIPPRLSSAVVRMRLGVAPEAPIILTVGRLTEQKGHRYLLEAIPSILAEFPDARFVWVGDGPLHDELCARLEQLRLAEQVLMLGRRNDVPDLMAASDLFVLPSLFEGLPLVILEALAAGKPVIATRAGGTPEIFARADEGILVAPGDSRALSAAICMALQQPELRQTWATAGQRRFAQAFSATRMAAETGTLYRRLLFETHPVAIN